MSLRGVATQNLKKQNLGENNEKGVECNNSLSISAGRRAKKAAVSRKDIAGR